MAPLLIPLDTRIWPHAQRMPPSRNVFRNTKTARKPIELLHPNAGNLKGRPLLDLGICVGAHTALLASGKCRLTDCMQNHDSGSKAFENKPPAVSVDVTSVFRRAGLPQTVRATQALEAKYQLLKPHDRCDHYDIIWAVRSAISGCLPTRPLRSRAGKALLLQFPSFQGGVCETDVEIVVEIASPEHICLMLPEEFQESSPQRVLVAENDEEVAQMLVRLLSREGFEVTLARSAAAVMSLVHAQPFDLLLLDEDLADIDGFELCSRLHAHHATAPIPVVIVSAWHGVNKLAKRVGAVGCLEKPLDLIDLPQRLRDFLRMSPTANA